MVMIGRISKGSKMDQIYISKERTSEFKVGTYVQIEPVLKKNKKIKKLFKYNASNIEPFKVSMVRKIVGYLEKYSLNNIIFIGSFLEKGFSFQDIDLICVSNTKFNNLKNDLEQEFKTTFHIIQMNTKNLVHMYNIDPIMQTALSKYVSTSRIIIKKNQKTNYKYLDLQLLRNRDFSLNYEYLSGKEKYKHIRSLVGIFLFLHNKRISIEIIDSYITFYFSFDVNDIKNNVIENKFKYIKEFDVMYKKTKRLIDKGLKNE